MKGVRQHERIKKNEICCKAIIAQNARKVKEETDYDF